MLEYEDHPRACGEQEDVGTQSNGYIGSPPRLRGADAVDTSASSTKRNTPAPAGSRILPYCALDLLKDHPRACGEQYWQAFLDRLNRGSPPRLRGADK